MVNNCCIFNCRSGHSKNGKRVSTFKAPTNEDLYKKWEEAFKNSGNVLKKTSFVCEKHFREEDIRRNCVLKDVHGNVLFHRTLNKQRLLPNAVPVFFDNYDENKGNNKENTVTKTQQNPQPSSAVVQDRLTISDQSASNLSSTPKTESDTNSLELNAATDNKSISHDYISRDDPVEIKSSVNSRMSNDKAHDVGTASICSINSDTRANSSTEGNFSVIFSTYNCLKLPNTLWAVHKVDEPKKMLIFTKVRPLFTKEPKAPVIEKQIVLQEDDKCHTLVYNNLMNLCDNCPKSLEEVELLIKKVDGLNVCTGGPSAHEYRNVHCTCAYKDSTNKWRHNLCHVILERGLICKHCSKLDNTLRRHFNYVAKRKNSIKRHLTASPTKKKCTKVNNKEARIKLQALRRYKERWQMIKAEIRKTIN